MANNAVPMAPAMRCRVFSVLVHQALIGYVRRRVLSGDQLASLTADVRKLSAEAFGLLGDGLAAYGGQPGE